MLRQNHSVYCNTRPFWTSTITKELNYPPPVTGESKDIKIEGIHSALLSFQKEKTAAGLGDTKGQHGLYTDLKTTLQAVQAGAKYGLVHDVTINPIGENSLIVRLTITHVPTGEDKKSEYLVSTVHPGARNQHQATGAAITYAKKYLYWGLYGLANADDDGQAVETIDSSQRGTSNNSPVTKRLTPRQQDIKKSEDIVEEIRVIYSKDQAGGMKIIDTWKEKHSIKAEFGPEAITTHELYMDLKKRVTAYKLDQQKNNNAKPT